MILRNPSYRRDFFFMACLATSVLFTTTLSGQGIQGVAREAISHHPVAHAVAAILHGDSVKTSIQVDVNGRFLFLTEEAMRVRVRVTALGYHPFMSEELVLDGYSTFQVDCKLERAPQELQEITIVSTARENEAYLYRITKDDLQNIAGNFDDPVRVAVSKPGIVQLNDQANHVSVRGMNPVLNTWHLEGLEIVNPSHTNNAGTFSDFPSQSGGGINLFSAQVLDETDVYTGVSPLIIGRSGGAAIDMHLNESTAPEKRIKAGLLGFELGGGIPAGSRGMIDINLRYSFTGLLADLGVDFGGETIRFMDAVASFHHEGVRHKLKIFGWGGRSTNEFNRVEDPGEQERFKDFFDIDFNSKLGGLGAKFIQSLSRKMSIGLGSSFSVSSTNYSRFGQFGAIITHIDFNDDIKVLSSSADLTFEISPQLIMNGGVQFINRNFERPVLNSLLDDESFLRPFLNFEIELAGLPIHAEAGADLKYEFSAFGTASLYPGYRVFLQWLLNQQYVFAGARHTAGQNIRTFSIEEPYSLPLLIDQYEIGWSLNEKKNNFMFKVYYQSIHNMPVFLADHGFIHFADADDLSPATFSGGNNDGKARSTGVEGEWSYHNAGWKFSVNQTVYASERSRLETGFEKGRFSGGHASHFSIAKELISAKKGKNRIWNFGLRGIYQGGLREQEIDNAASLISTQTIFIQPGTFTAKLPDYKRVDAGISRTIANAGVRWRYSLDIQNVFSFTNPAYHYYDPFLERVEAQEQLGIIPVLSVQVSW